MFTFHQVDIEIRLVMDLVELTNLFPQARQWRAPPHWASHIYIQLSIIQQFSNPISRMSSLHADSEPSLQS